MPATVLILIEDPTVCEALREVCARSGYNALGSCSAEEALAALQDHAVNLIVLDDRLLEDGARLRRELNRRGIQTPILVLSTAPRLGFIGIADEVLRKPIQVEGLLGKIQEWLLRMRPQ